MYERQVWIENPAMIARNTAKPRGKRLLELKRHEWQRRPQNRHPTDAPRPVRQV